MGALKVCPRYYQYTIIDGWTPRGESVHLTFGLHYHSALEHYDFCKTQGQDHETALRSALKKAMILTWDSVLRRPWSSDHKNKNRFTLLRSIVWYLDQFRDDPFQTIILANGKPAVELSFRFQTSYTVMTGESVLWCGHMDRMAMWNDNVYILDRKTTTSTIDERFFAKFSPDNQFSGYATAGQVVYKLPIKGIVVDGAQIAVTFTRFQRQIVMRHQDSLDEWYRGIGVYVGLAEQFAAAGFWPQNEKSCGNYGGCPFQGVCSKPESVRATWLKADFQRRVWDPLVAREAS